MHEAGAVAAALQRGLTATSGTRPLTLLIRDPVRAESQAVRFYAREFLRDWGFGTLRLEVRTLRTRCSECGSWVRPTPADPVCSRCGAPIATRSGPAVTVSTARIPWGPERCA
jgi:hypothetical protein